MPIDITNLLIFLAVVALLFGGATKIPELARALGRAMGEFKKGQAEIERELSSLNTSAPSNHVDNTAQPSVQTADERDRKIAELEKQLGELKGKSSKA
jgi:sec-independent protein translocase protein TatA